MLDRPVARSGFSIPGPGKNPGRPMAVRLQVSADARPECIPPLRNVAASYAGEMGLSDAQIYAVKLCVGEAVTNVVEHAYPERDPGSVEVSLDQVEDELEVVVADHGRPRHRKQSNDEGGGFGLAMISRLMSHCIFTAASDGTTVEMGFPLPRRNQSGRGIGESVRRNRALRLSASRY
ncbi:MAG TPA: ATP-binding protein [Gaiellaceae bacterium]|nr:ATP-binding protein [Gaiellaceae bacterium]